MLSNALALHHRGEARPDGLSLVDFRVKLTVSWRAREIHPWDVDLPEERAMPRLADQTFQDTEDAVERLFTSFPEANALELNVFDSEPESDRIIMNGIVDRSELGRFRSSSVEMRLKMLGIHYRLLNYRFDTLARMEPPPPKTAERDYRSNRPLAAIRQLHDVAAKSRTRWPDGSHREH